MGLFSRTNSGNPGQEEFDEIDLPTSDDLKGGMFTSEEPATPVAAAPVRRTTPVKGSYGIEDAIKLMRSLPRDNNEVVVTVVKKTLESTNIKVTEIVDDANQKETRIRNQHKTLEGEIKELQDQIAHRNQQISDLLQDLKETTDVRQRLQLAMELDPEKMQQPKAQAAATTAVEASASPAQAAQNPAAKPHVANNLDPNARRRMQPRSNPQH